MILRRRLLGEVLLVGLWIQKTRPASAALEDLGAVVVVEEDPRILHATFGDVCRDLLCAIKRRTSHGGGRGILTFHVSVRSRIVEHQNIGATLAPDHAMFYRAMFEPFVAPTQLVAEGTLERAPDSVLELRAKAERTGLGLGEPAQMTVRMVGMPAILRLQLVRPNDAVAAGAGVDPIVDGLAGDGAFARRLFGLLLFLLLRDPVDGRGAFVKHFFGGGKRAARERPTFPFILFPLLFLFF